MSITLQAVEEARARIRGIVLRTPLVRLNTDGEAASEDGVFSNKDEVFLKLESLQPIGSFKIRGAANAMMRAPRETIERGVLTASAGNMAQGVAYYARKLGVPATVITPDSAPATKLRAVERMGGRIIKVPFDTWWRTFEDRAFPGVD